MEVRRIDHLVLAVADVEASLEFYERVLGMTRLELDPGRWSLVFGENRIGLQPVDDLPAISEGTVRGSGNFCVISDRPMTVVTAHLEACGVELIEGPIEKHGAGGPILSVYFRDPDGNLVEVATPVFS